VQIVVTGRRIVGILTGSGIANVIGTIITIIAIAISKTIYASIGKFVTPLRGAG
jgi:hypothetical protein